MAEDYSGALFELHHGNVSGVYKDWPSPDVIISDGAYGDVIVNRSCQQGLSGNRQPETGAGAIHADRAGS